MKHRVLAALVAAVAALGVGTPSAQAITGNFEPDFEHEYVGLVVFYDEDGDVLHRCSGSLLTDTVFLTAGHCVTVDDKGTLAASARVYFEQDAGADYNAATGVDPTTGYPLTGGIESHELYSYGFTSLATIPQTRDVGLVILDKPVTTVYPKVDTYASLAAPGTLEEYGTGIDATVDLSGYGVSRANKNHPVSYRSRLQAESFIIGLRGQLAGGYNIKIASNPGGGRGGTCFGDSGGPVLLGGTDVIVGVNSFVLNGNCAGTGFAYRTDQRAVIRWILAHAGDEASEIDIVRI